MTYFCYIWAPFCISGAGEDRHFKFGALIDHSELLSADDMLPPTGAWPGSRGSFKFWQNSGDVSETVQDSDMVTTGDY